MKLYYFETSNPRKACAVARYLNSPVEFVRVDLMKGEHKSPDYLAVNPNGKVPALVDGNVRLWESTAIMIHLSNRAGSDLWPRDPARQADTVRWLVWDAAHFSRHASTLYFEN
jgi:glutathione S-transferase